LVPLFISDTILLNVCVGLVGQVMQEHEAFLDKCLKQCMFFWPKIFKVIHTYGYLDSNIQKLEIKRSNRDRKSTSLIEYRS